MKAIAQVKTSMYSKEAVVLSIDYSIRRKGRRGLVCLIVVDGEDMGRARRG